MDHQHRMQALASRRETVRALRQMNRGSLAALGFRFNLGIQLRGVECLFPMLHEEVQILTDPNKETNDKILRCVLRYVKKLTFSNPFFISSTIHDNARKIVFNFT